MGFTNCIRYFPTQAFNLSFKDSIKKMFPKYSPKQDFGMFFAVNMASGGLAAAGSLTIVYPLDYARTRLASDVGSGKKTFDGLFDCLKKTASGPKGFFSLYAGFGVSLGGIIPYRGFQLDPFDTVRRRLQMQAEKPVEQHIYKGTVDCLKKIAAEEGIAAGVYKGFVANALRSFGGALVLVLYDRAKNYLGLGGSSGSE